MVVASQKQMDIILDEIRTAKSNRLQNFPLLPPSGATITCPQTQNIFIRDKMKMRCLILIFKNQLSKIFL